MYSFWCHGHLIDPIVWRAVMYPNVLFHWFVATQIMHIVTNGQNSDRVMIGQVYYSLQLITSYWKYCIRDNLDIWGNARVANLVNSMWTINGPTFEKSESLKHRIDTQTIYTPEYSGVQEKRVKGVTWPRCTGSRAPSSHYIPSNICIPPCTNIYKRSGNYRQIRFRMVRKEVHVWTWQWTFLEGTISDIEYTVIYFFERWILYWDLTTCMKSICEHEISKTIVNSYEWIEYRNVEHRAFRFEWKFNNDFKIAKLFFLLKNIWRGWIFEILTTGFLKRFISIAIVSNFGKIWIGSRWFGLAVVYWADMNRELIKYIRLIFWLFLL